jgi:hypothetical protein
MTMPAWLRFIAARLDARLIADANESWNELDIASEAAAQIRGRDYRTAGERWS